eukprot:TRINITY_DN20797_c0_g1_i1.p1 TRINITY_DN20797_c0_g1~~TRINITY_DN20797_c0_g1_i1.p1  ORF type:complete len:181 (-),score=31.34 TRINITY_DN20797_c0_g1_i1:240-782(-)
MDEGKGKADDEPKRIVDKGKGKVDDSLTNPKISSGENEDDEAISLAIQADMQAEDGEGFAIYPLTTCPHLVQVTEDMSSLPLFDALCSVCNDPSENWVCLTCKKVFCGRYVGGHMVTHSKEATHPVALGFRDLSIWCFECDNYIDEQGNENLWPMYTAFHRMKFGAEPPARAAIVVLQTT